MKRQEHTAWSSGIYPCSRECGFVGQLDAFTHGECYAPCPKCGAERKEKTGRFIYEMVPARGILGWIGMKRKVFIGVEWYKERS